MKMVSARHVSQKEGGSSGSTGKNNKGGIDRDV